MPKRGYGERGEVSATELAEMGFCEKRVQLASIYGDRVTPEQRRARARGRDAHQQYFEEGVAASADRRCFVATFVFGPDAAETQVLRAYRDAVLTRGRWGRLLVSLYYRTAPAVCRFLEAEPVAVVAVQRLLRPVVAWCDSALGKRGAR
jgi:hypothetical protein